MTATTERFSGRGGDYRAARPGYSAEAVAYLMGDSGLGAPLRIADVGSGTGILSRQLLAAASVDAVVFGIEPNASMRTEAETDLLNDGRFRSVDGSAEATLLPNDSVDAITVAQAFHWFDVQRTRTEFLRILKPGGRVALIWNMRSEDANAFHQGYEQYLRDWGNGYLDVRETWMIRRQLESFFTRGCEERQFPYMHELDATTLRSRLLSSSYAPIEGSSSFDRAMS